MPLSIAFSDGEFELVACSWHLHRVVVVDIGSVGAVSGDNCYDQGGGGGSVSAAFDVDGGGWQWLWSACPWWLDGCRH